jgi:hypothetical protein
MRADRGEGFDARGQVHVPLEIEEWGDGAEAGGEVLHGGAGDGAADAVGED